MVSFQVIVSATSSVRLTSYSIIQREKNSCNWVTFIPAEVFIFLIQVSPDMVLLTFPLVEFEIPKIEGVMSCGLRPQAVAHAKILPSAHHEVLPMSASRKGPTHTVAISNKKRSRIYLDSRSPALRGWLADKQYLNWFCIGHQTLYPYQPKRRLWSNNGIDCTSRQENGGYVVIKLRGQDRLDQRTSSHDLV